MIRLNRMTDYAIVVLGALTHKLGETIATAALAELTGLKQPTVAKVAKILLAADLLVTQRGVNGGYRLVRPAHTISLVDIVEAMEGPIAVTDCVEGAQDPCAVSNCCFMANNWNRVNLAIRDALGAVTLKDLTDPAQLFPLPESVPKSGRLSADQTARHKARREELINDASGMTQMNQN
jgi:FeS assembly SUF system regulator